ncbi:MAG: hypothetical protein WC897_02415 [Candidatus Gracilibacteria bacterium]
MRKALLILGLMGGCKPSNEEAQTQQAQVESPQEIITKVSLGNIDFVFEADSGFTEREKSLVEDCMQKAYARLSQTLGDEVMQFPEHKTVKVHKIDPKINRGSVEFGEAEIKLNKNLEPELQNKSLGEIGLNIGEISDPNLANEFIHLFAQGSFFWSEAFYEGMVYGLINHLYPNYYSSLPDFHLNVVRQKCVATLFEKGWDYDYSVNSSLGEGIADEGLQRLIHSEWAIVWGDFISKHPEFPKRFFSLVLEERKKGKLDFSRDELWQMAQQAEPNFEGWHNSIGASIKPIEAQTALYAVETGSSQFSVFNFTSIPTSTPNGHLHAGSIEQKLTGQAILLDPSNQAIWEIPQGPFARVTVPGIPNLRENSVSIAGKTIPFLDSSKCQPK